MSLIRWKFVLSFLFLVVFSLNTLTSFGQPPVEILVPENISPTSVDPKSLPQSQLSSLLSDKNRENTGKDRNAEKNNNTRLDKDSVIKDNIRPFK